MMFPETALFVVNYILARRPRSPSPRRVFAEMPWKRLSSLHPPSYSIRHGLQDYWISPQRRHLAGSAWHTPARRVLVLPGSTGISDVESAHWPSSGQYRHNLIWKNRWQYLNHYYLGKRTQRSSRFKHLSF